MKFARRQQAEAPDAAADPTPATPPPPPSPPRGAPVTVFADVLDGRTLWLAIDERPGSLALRDTDSGDVIALAGDLADDQPGYRSIRVDLGGLPGTDDAAYDVVLVPSGGRPAKPVWSAPLDRRPIPPADDGATQWSIGRTDEGMLQLRRGAPSPAAELRAIEVEDAGLRLTVAGPGDTLALLDDADEPAAQFPVSDGSVTISADSLPEITAPLRVVLGEPGAWLPVRRRANDLAQPGRGAPLPELETSDSSCQLRWSPQALLLLAPMGAGR